MFISIADPTDPRVADYMGLRDHDLRRRREAPDGDMAGVFIAEGELVIERALAAGHALKSLLVDALKGERPGFAVPEGVAVYAAGPDVVRAVTGMHLHRGLIACFHRPSVHPVEAVVGGARRLVVVERVTNPTNLGLIVRSAAALGMDGLLIDPTSCDPLYRRASRVAMGASFSFPWTRVGELPGGLQPVRNAGFEVVALTPNSGAMAIGEYRPGEKVALVLGAEGPGLSEETLAAADHRVAIPMHHGVDSLNVGIAAAVAFYAVNAVRI